MLESSRTRILERLPDDALVVDVGGWADPLERADWVVDLMPYETRGLYRREGWIDRPAQPERFSADTWVQRDLCAREPLPFADGQVDFVVCGHTLEDLRDPLWVCGELARIARAGYVEVPSRMEEQSFGVEGEWAGWRHHRWLIDMDGDHLEFALKDHSLHSDPDSVFPRGFVDRLTADERVHALWWEGSFTSSERLFVDEDPRAAYLPDFVSRHRTIAARARRRLRRT